MTQHPDKRFASFVRSIDDPIRLIGVVIRKLGRSDDGDIRELVRRAQIIHSGAMQARRRERAAAKREGVTAP